MLKLKTGIDMVHVPCKGGGNSTQDVISGQVQLTFENTTVLLPLARSGSHPCACGNQQRGADLTAFLYQRDRDYCIGKNSLSRWYIKKSVRSHDLRVYSLDLPSIGSSLRRALSPDFSAGALALFIPWRVGAEESGAAKEAFGGALSARPARPARAAWAAQRLLAARW
jgi:hypothetical protein